MRGPVLRKLGRVQAIHPGVSGEARECFGKPVNRGFARFSLGNPLTHPLLGFAPPQSPALQLKHRGAISQRQMSLLLLLSTVIILIFQ